MATLPDKIVKVLFIATLLILPLGELGRIQINNSIAITVNDIFVFITVISWFIKSYFQKIKIEALFSRALLFLSAIFLFTLIINITKYDIHELNTSFLYFLRWFLYMGLYFVVSSFSGEFKKSIKMVLVIVGSMFVLLGYMQYLLYPNLRNLYYLGWDEHLYRLFSSFLDPNFAGVFIVLFLIFLIGMMIEKIVNRTFIGLISISAFFAMLLTYSRSALLSFIVTFTVALWIFGKKRFILFFLILIIGITTLLPLAYKTEGTNLLRFASIDARFDSAQKALTIFLHSPLYGVGFNAYRYAGEQSGVLDTKSSVQVNHAAAGTDNSFLFVLATAGVAGFAAFLYVWIHILKKNYRFFKEANNKQSLVVVLSIISLFVSSLFINALFYPFIMEWIWIQIGLTEHE